MDDERDDDQQTAIVAYQSNALMRAEIDTQISTAKAFPRSLAKFSKDAKAMATLDQETAASCIYALPRGGKKIEGPSARFAEIVAVAWKNMRFGGRVVSEETNFLTAQGIAHDLESNIAITVDVRTRITKSGKNGQKPERYNDDMIQVAGLAATSKALRNAVLKVVPKAYWQPILNEAKRVALGDASTLGSRRDGALKYFNGLGVKTDRILAALDKRGVEDIDLEDLATLTGIRTAINEGDTTLEQAFPVQQTSTASAAKEKLKTPATPATPAAPSEPEKPEPPQEKPPEVAPCTAEQRDDLEQYRQNLELNENDIKILLGLAKAKAWAKLNHEQADIILKEMGRMAQQQSGE